ncbi:hypothetical protein METBIDRAFT_11893 [Metschnikowia bicuspidata var. bicuspidata NRRL YB-4993]|uniref:Major facilitator superfamily (MFS) profile domain-containing protein n=1 Tax=Metschnikowia bicuspidata var. bicuspidata NRRL YB-4993 TaxID=869754 RepID=A0A1A0HB60_9ASCO|nr:hypothetical protein METBIDRAFT_11893 [Metschnikowia bicuspidata var. bicuspidata NRRL YB-4993]OBA21364.1 hypothetical protein METBIDRAFT_11893 [Metschnikowia bicuspidata var. bicuspidata NRRL YB-4993]
MQKFRKRTFTAVSAQIWQQLTGMNIMMYYIVCIFQIAGYNGNTNLVPSLIQYILNMAVTIPALFTSDLLGRRTILLAGAALMMAFQFGVAGILATYSEPVFISDTVRITIPEENKSATKGVIACCYSFVPLHLSGALESGFIAGRYIGGMGRLAIQKTWSFTFHLCKLDLQFCHFHVHVFIIRNITWKAYCIYATFCAFAELIQKLEISHEGNKI